MLLALRNDRWQACLVATVDDPGLDLAGVQVAPLRRDHAAVDLLLFDAPVGVEPLHDVRRQQPLLLRDVALRAEAKRSGAHLSDADRPFRASLVNQWRNIVVIGERLG